MSFTAAYSSDIGEIAFSVWRLSLRHKNVHSVFHNPYIFGTYWATKLAPILVSLFPPRQKQPFQNDSSGFDARLTNLWSVNSPFAWLPQQLRLYWYIAENLLQLHAWKPPMFGVEQHLAHLMHFEACPGHESCTRICGCWCETSVACSA